MPKPQARQAQHANVSGQRWPAIQTDQIETQLGNKDQCGKNPEILHQIVAERTVPVDLFQVCFAHHAPAVGRAWQTEGHTLADYRNVTIVGVTGVFDVGVLALANGFAHTRVQLAGGRIGKAHLELGMLAHADRAPPPPPLPPSHTGPEGVVSNRELSRGHRYSGTIWTPTTTTSSPC